MARAAIILAILAVVLNAQCFGDCIADAAQQSKSCHQNQKKSVEPCGHSQLVSGKETPSPASPLTFSTLLDPIAPPVVISENVPARLTQSPSPPAPSSTAILKI